MTDQPLSPKELQALVALDTPTVCNALELLLPDRRGFGFTVEPLVCAFPDLPPMVGYARTATVRATRPSAKDKKAAQEQRLAYYAYVEQGPRPSVAVIQDVDARPGFGAFWGEVNSAIHKGLGCIGTVTNGCMRDLAAIAEGFQLLAGSIAPSHAWVHLEETGCAVNIHGMIVQPGDLVHADRHGAVVIPHDVARQVPGAAALIGRRESVILAAARKPGFNVEALRKAMGDAEEIH
jgi:regulator of RNase E activity RraA